MGLLNRMIIPNLLTPKFHVKCKTWRFLHVDFFGTLISRRNDNSRMYFNIFLILFILSWKWQSPTHIQGQFWNQCCMEATERSKQGGPLFIGNIFYVNEKRWFIPCELSTQDTLVDGKVKNNLFFFIWKYVNEVLSGPSISHQCTRWQTFDLHDNTHSSISPITHPNPQIIHKLWLRLNVPGYIFFWMRSCKFWGIVNHSPCWQVCTLEFWFHIKDFSY